VVVGDVGSGPAPTGRVVVVVVEPVVVVVVAPIVVVVVVVDDGLVTMVVVVVDGDELPGAGGGGYTSSGVEDPGVGFQPGGGFFWEGTGPAVATTSGGAGFCTLGGWCSGTGVPGACTRPNPARSDHQMELTWTTVPVCGALIISPSPM
jgi:hypothetical protein